MNFNPVLAKLLPNHHNMQNGMVPPNDTLEHLTRMLRTAQLAAQNANAQSSLEHSSHGHGAGMHHGSARDESPRRRPKKKGNWKPRRTASPETEPLAAAAAAVDKPRTVVSSTLAPGGGRIVSSRDEKGHIHMRVEYDRDQMLRCAHSPYSALPPAAIKNIVVYMPEIVSQFPVRHGVHQPRYVAPEQHFY